MNVAEYLVFEFFLYLIYQALQKNFVQCCYLMFLISSTHAIGPVLFASSFFLPDYDIFSK